LAGRVGGSRYLHAMDSRQYQAPTGNQTQILGHSACLSHYTNLRRTNKVHSFFINDLIQLYCLRHISSN